MFKHYILFIALFLFYYSVGFAQSQDSTLDNKTFYIKQNYILDSSLISKKNINPNSIILEDTNNNSVYFDLLDEKLIYIYAPKNNIKPLAWKESKTYENQHGLLSFEGGSNSFINAKLSAGLFNKNNTNIAFDGLYTQAKGLITGLNPNNLSTQISINKKFNKVNAFADVYYNTQRRNYLSTQDTSLPFFENNSWNKIGFQSGFSNIQLSKKNINYSSNISGYLLMNKYNSVETNINLSFGIQKLISEKYKITVLPFINYLSYQSKDNSIYGIQLLNKISLNTTAIEGNILLNNIANHLFGELKVTSNINTNLTLEANLHKNLIQNSLNNYISNYSPYLSLSNVNIKNQTNTGLDINIKYNKKQLNLFNLGYSYDQIANFSFMDFDSTNNEIVSFSPQYEDVYRHTLRNDLYFYISDKVNVKSQLLYYIFDRPNGNNSRLLNFIPYLTWKSDVNVNITKALVLNFTSKLVGNRGYINDNQYYTLSKFIDLGGKVEYKINKKINTFLGVYNILGSKYQEYYNYPSIGRIFSLGILVKF